MPHELITLLIALGLVTIHVLSGRLTTIPEVPRSRWLSFSWAIPVAFVFLALLPALASDQQALSGAVSGVLDAVGKHVYAIALVGFIVFYGTERAVKQSQENKSESDSTNAVASGRSCSASAGSR